MSAGPPGRREGRQLEVSGRQSRLWGNRAPIVLVPLDGSAEAKAALPAARLVAGIAGASIHAVYAAERPLPREELLRQMDLRREERHQVVVEQVIDPPAEAIVRLAEERRTMCIAMTTRGRTAYLGRTVRPVVEKVVQAAPCPVLLVRPEIAPRLEAMRALRHILLPLDGAPSSAAVIGPALDLASRGRAEVEILYVATLAQRPGEPGTLTAPRYVDQPQHEWPAWAREFLSTSSLARWHVSCSLPLSYSRPGTGS